MNVLSSWGGQVVSLALAFFVTPVIVGALGDSSYGIWMLIASIAGYLGLLDLGVRGAVMRYVARFTANRDHEAASHTLSSSIQIFSLMGAAAVLASLMLALFAVSRFEIPPASVPAARIALVIVGLNIGVSLVGGAYAGAVVALQRLDLLRLADVAAGICQTVAIVGAVFAGHGLVAMAFIQLVVSVSRVAWFTMLIRRLDPRIRVDLRSARFDYVRLIFSFSSISFVLHVGSRLIYYTDALVIAAFLPVGVLTYFAIAGNLVASARMLTSSLSFTASPMASSFEGAGDHDKVKRVLLTSARYSMMILLPVATTLLIRGGSFIALWMGPSYAGPAGQVLAVLAIPLLFHGGTHGVGGIMMAVGKHRPMVPALLIEAAANLVLSIALVGTLGIVGVAWGTMIPSVVASLVFWPWYVRRALDVPLGLYISTIWIRPWLAAVPFAVATYVAQALWPAASLIGFFGQVAACLVVAAAADWWLCVSDTERERLLAGARRGFRRLAPGTAN